MNATNRFAWFAWSTEYPEDGSILVFAPDDDPDVALAAAVDALGYRTDVAQGDGTEASFVTIDRAPQFDQYAATGEVPDDVRLGDQAHDGRMDR